MCCAVLSCPSLPCRCVPPPPPPPRVDNERVVTNRPLAGTRRRGVTPEADKALEQELLADQKEVGGQEGGWTHGQVVSLACMLSLLHGRVEWRKVSFASAAVSGCLAVSGCKVASRVRAARMYTSPHVSMWNLCVQTASQAGCVVGCLGLGRPSQQSRLCSTVPTPSGS